MHSPDANLSVDDALIPEAELCAVLVLDALGHVVATNRSARQLWRVEKGSLVGVPVAELLVSRESAPELPEARWKALLGQTLERTGLFLARPLDAAPREVGVRVERSFGGAGSYIATIHPHVSNGGGKPAAPTSP